MNVCACTHTFTHTYTYTDWRLRVSNMASRQSPEQDIHTKLVHSCLWVRVLHTKKWRLVVYANTHACLLVYAYIYAHTCIYTHTHTCMLQTHICMYLRLRMCFAQAIDRFFSFCVELQPNSRDHPRTIRVCLDLEEQRVHIDTNMRTKKHA